MVDICTTCLHPPGLCNYSPSPLRNEYTTRLLMEASRSALIPSRMIERGLLPPRRRLPRRALPRVVDEAGADALFATTKGSRRSSSRTILMVLGLIVPLRTCFSMSRSWIFCKSRLPSSAAGMRWLFPTLSTLWLFSPSCSLSTLLSSPSSFISSRRAAK